MESEVVEVVRSIIGDESAELHVPWIPENAKKYVLKCLDSGKLSAGIKVKKFEEMICEISNAKYAVACCNGTSALYATLMCLGLTNGYIKIPALTFIATANAVIQTGMKPHFVEFEDANLPVDLLGCISSAQGMVRDSCQAFGARISGTRIYSFNQNKIITTSLGGAIVTDDESLAKEISHRITTARISHPWKIEHNKTGWNFRMSDVNAAIGIAQLEIFHEIMQAKHALAERYKEAFDKIGIQMIESKNNWLNTVLVPSEKQESIIKALHEKGWKARYLPTPLSLLIPYKDFPCDNIDQSIDIWKRAISLPSSPYLGFRYV